MSYSVQVSYLRQKLSYTLSLKSTTILQDICPLFEAKIACLLNTYHTFFFKNHTNQTYKITQAVYPMFEGNFYFNDFYFSFPSQLN